MSAREMPPIWSIMETQRLGYQQGPAYGMRRWSGLSLSCMFSTQDHSASSSVGAVQLSVGAKTLQVCPGYMRAWR